jgi:GTP-binding protein EngB required for normal cell division
LPTTLNIQERLHDKEWKQGSDCGENRPWYTPDAGTSITRDGVEQLRVLGRTEAKLGSFLVIPKVIVLGSGNTGKSTVLNRFIQFQVLSARDGVCTKRPVKVEMRDTAPGDARFDSADPQEQRIQAIVTVKDTRDNCIKEFVLKGTSPEQLHEADHRAMLDYVEARSAPVDDSWGMQLKSLVRGAAQPPMYLAEELIVKIEAPGMMYFDLVDLPGLEWVHRQTADTIQKYFNQATIMNTFVLVFRDASKDPRHCQFAAKFYEFLREVMDKGELQQKDIEQQLIGIYTKVDKELEPASSKDDDATVYNQTFARKVETWLADKFADEINQQDPTNKVPKIEWMAVLNPNPNETAANMSFSDAFKKEAWFYDALFPPRSEMRSRCGIDALRTRLMQKYSHFCQQRVQKCIWPLCKCKLEDTYHKLTTSWSWDRREEGTDLEKRALLTETLETLFASTDQLSKQFWAHEPMKAHLADCAKMRSLPQCKTRIVGVATTLMTKSLPHHLVRSGESQPKLKKLARFRFECLEKLKVKAKQRCAAFCEIEYVALEKEQKEAHVAEAAAGIKSADLDCQGLVYRSKNALRIDGPSAIEAARCSMVDVVNDVNTGAWLDDDALESEYATLCSNFRILRKVAYDLNDTFKRVGKGVVGTEMCPPPPQ